MYEQFDKIENKGKARMFKNPVLEALTRTSPTLTLAVYVPVLVGLFVIGVARFDISILTAIGIYLFAFFFWTFMEYLLHRYFFHFVRDNPLIQRFHYMIHGVHHHYPRDAGRLFMPPVPGLIIATLLFSFFYLFWGTYIFAFFPGFMTGYLFYSFMHYFMHVYKPPKALKFLWAHHSLHHYKYQDKAFGVSTPIWDYVFGTMPPKDSSDAERSQGAV